MKKSIALVVVVLTTLPFIGCDSFDFHNLKSNDIYYQLTLENFSEYLVYPLESQYKANTVVIVTTQIIYDANIVLYLNGELVTQTSADTPYWTYEFIMPEEDSVLNFNVETIEGTETIFDFTEILSPNIPVDYFQADLEEVSYEELYDLSTIISMLGDSNQSNFTYGNISESNTERFNIVTQRLIYSKYENDSVFQNSFYQYKGRNTEITQNDYQYTQIIDGAAYSLNQTNGELSSSNFVIQGNYTFWYELSPKRFNLLNEEVNNITYKMGNKDESTIVQIIGEFFDETEELYDTACEITYIIENDHIIAWIYTETATSPILEGFWKTTQYCIPYDGEINFIDEVVITTND
ncbi:MAG: hypothetical protein WCY80_00910 [Candidatus Izemoplasmatales bacterium]